MNDTTVYTRRQWLGRTLTALAVISTAKTIGCGNKETASTSAPAEPAAPDCTSTEGLTPQQLQTRTSLSYVEQATDPNKACSKCQFYQAPQGGASCGGCQLNLGQVNPEGSCTSFTAKMG